ncbi:MAG TPA: hypothetical protein VGP68_04320 [Gemmataceae bacterium]|nr:hypothetical protein [Gemmataceae bacterium]
MKSCWSAAAAGVVLVSALPLCRADEPLRVQSGVRVQTQTFELMPPLQGTTGQLPPTIATRQNRYEPWQNYGVSDTGRFCPRVLMFPDGECFWAYDGTSYPWLSTHMRQVVPFFISL